jgi:hypothetical protein
MASETFKKRQKERARQERKQQKADRLRERRNEKAKTDSLLQGEGPETAGSVSGLEPAALTKRPNQNIAPVQ